MNKLSIKSHKWVLILSWIVAGLILLQVLLILGGLIRSSVIYSKTGVFGNTVTSKELRQNKEHFEEVADIASKIFDDDYENNPDLTFIVLNRNFTAEYHYKDESLNKTVRIEASEKYETAFNAFRQLLIGEDNGEADCCVTVNANHIIFSGKQSSIVYQKDGISKPKTIETPLGEKEVASVRLSWKWFECIPKTK